MDEVNIVITPPGAVGVTIANPGGRLPYYTGEYTVTPDVEEDITLPTANKSLRENITVGKVPTYTVGNPSGGNTFIIGGQDNA